MAFILLFLAIAAAIGAAVLWRAAARQEAAATQPQPAAPAPVVETIEAAEPPVDDAEEISEQAIESELLPERKPVFAAMPGATRRARREWAQARGYEFSAKDDYLVDEFTRGAAASGHAPRDIVAGQVLGHEMLLMDIGGVGVMAMRTGAASDVVVDFRRPTVLADKHSEDLVEVTEVCGFEVFSTDAAVAERLIDVRVSTALEALPEEVSAVWLESEWALAQTTKGAHQPQWDAMQAPLALLADAARVLPPRSTAAQALHLSEGDPTRAMEQEAATLAAGPFLVAPVEDPYEHPPIQRPEEPVEMPTRIVGTAKGPVSHRPLGVDEVDAIADGKERPSVDGNSPRVRRNLEGGSSIFEDGR